MGEQRMQLPLLFDQPALPQSRKEARALGLKTYFTGKPCSRGNIAPRHVSGPCQCEACKADRRERAAAWNKAPENAERVSEIKTKWASKPENRAQILAGQQAYRRRTAAAASARAMEWQRRHPERARLHRQRWAKKNPGALKVYAKRRNAAVIAAKPIWWSKWDVFVLQEAKDLAKRRTALTGIPWDIDHAIPIQGREASGLHCAANVQVIPRVLNSWKRGRLVLIEPGEWIKHL